MKHVIVLIALLSLPALCFGQQYTTKQASLPCINKEFQVVAHILRDTMGALNILESDIDNAIDTLNKYFAPVCMSFNVCEVRIIDNFQYDNTENENEWNELKVKYYQDNRINVFFAAAIDWADEECGFADQAAITTPEDRGGILMNKSCVIDEPKWLVHQMGHFFGLLNTFDTEEGEELVSGENCDEAGDLVCDTPADPYVLGDPVENYVDVDLGCRFIDGSTDSEGQVYIPHVGNIMSFYQDECKCGLTHGQYLRIVEHYRMAPVKYW